ncbi:GntR family transcriptional regulator [Streptomonospora nanhaiensis]|uniref:DNA-binding GntR family transcriptional regulator n=1 Tax=Streptomonospora nanhaiensis TaxID=1323731 RepID=A0A853BWQ6_9ACTN|nr:GntR family transcriptional regulator [Streptomonospora nanhaiensis]MBV2364684.1 GntR family transcriptional regulator [Streptomonospora nanhaiensis]MBX9389547.1 GntR family transcriptional regulator [Streptomonospora nanhaiensis]NYI99246.1 DNA-binding GntR family transcriptional regulator [Streptomonospora nanhaiensis]
MTSPRLEKGVLTSPVQRPAPLRDSVYETLLELITRRRLPPGQHLVENELAEQLGVSRQPVREALQRLSNEGWVDLRPGYGAFVHQPSESEAEQLLAVRTLLETEAARLAAASATPEGVERLRELWRAGVAGLERGDSDAMVDRNAELHRSITELSGNAVLAGLAGQVARRVRWYHGLVVTQRGRESWDEHERIIDAIEAGDSERAAALMREHTEATRLAYHERAADASAEAESDRAAGL